MDADGRRYRLADGGGSSICEWSGVSASLGRDRWPAQQIGLATAVCVSGVGCRAVYTADGLRWRLFLHAYATVTENEAEAAARPRACGI